MADDVRADTADDSLLLDIYRTQVLCRAFETALIRRAARDGTGIPHPYSGQEGVAAGVCHALRPEDRVISPHRMLGHAIAKGADLVGLAAELYGRRTGLCKGRSNEMYVCDYDNGFMGATQIVAGNLPMAVGLALASGLSESGRVVAAFVGDGGVNQGTFHESLNLAAVWKLPLLVIVENNGYAQTTPVEYATAGSIVGRAAAYSIPGHLVDGQDALAVHACVSEAAARARSGQGPSLIEARTYRYEGHFYGDQHRRYRTPEEVAHWRERDPLALQRSRLLSRGHPESELDEIADAAAARAEQVLAVAAAAPEPGWDDLTSDVFAESDAVSDYLRESLAREAYSA